jgi:hypothetical protein
VRGELWDQAVAYNRQLGMRAQERAANAEAVSCFEEALRALARIPPTRATTEAEIDLRSAMRPALLQLGRLDEVLAVSKQVEQLALQLGDEQSLARAYTYLINYHYLKGETALTIDYGTRCIAIAEACQDTSIRAPRGSTWDRATRAWRVSAGRARARTQHQRPNPPATSLPTFHPAPGCVQPGRARRVRTAARYAHDAQQAGGQRPGLQPDDRADLAGLVAVRRGHAGRAVLLPQRSFEICRKRGLTVWHPISASLLGSPWCGSERTEGLRLLEDSVAMSRQLGVNAIWQPDGQSR